MAHAISRRSFASCIAAAILAGGLTGGFFGYATAQEASGWLNTDCAGRCTANGYEAEFCGQV